MAYGRYLSPREVAHLAYDVGWHDTENLHMAVRIAFAESSTGPMVATANGYEPVSSGGFFVCDSQSLYTNTDGSRDRGIWQINDKAHPMYTDAAMFDPVLNAKAAFQVFKDNGNTFNPWSSLGNTTYLNYWAEAAEGCMQRWLDSKGRPLIGHKSGTGAK